MRCSDASLVDVQGDIGGIVHESGVNTVAISSRGTPCGGCPERDNDEGQDDCRPLQVVIIILEVLLWETAEYRTFQSNSETISRGRWFHWCALEAYLHQ